MSSFIITADNPKVLALRKKEPRLGVIVDLLGDISFRDYSDGYSFIVCQIVGQMISQRVAKVFCERLHALCDGEISPRTISRFPRLGAEKHRLVASEMPIYLRVHRGDSE